MMRLLLVLAAAALMAAGPSHRQVVPAASPRPAPAPVTPRLKPSLQPPDVSVDPVLGGSADLVLLVPFDGTVPIEDAAVTLLAPPGVVVSVKPPGPFPMAQDMAWTIHATMTEQAPQSAKVTALLTYRVHGAAPKIDSVSATVSQLPMENMAATLKPVLVPSEGSLDQYNCLRLSLQLANSDRRTAWLGDIRLLSPPYVRLAEIRQNQAPATPEDSRAACPASSNRAALLPAPFAIRPGASASVALTLVTSQAVVPGSYSLVLSYAVGPRATSVTEVATTQGKVTIGVPGVSDVMSLLGVPSFLLLPGALTVASFFLVFTLGRASAQFDWKSPKFLLSAVTLSFAYGVLYPLLVAHASWLSFDYVHGYNVFDAAVLWVGSIAIGAGAAGVARLVEAVRATRAARRLAAERDRMEPADLDDPLSLLAKLARHHADFRLQALRPNDGRPEDTVLRIPFGAAGAGQIWVTSAAVARDGDPPLVGDRKQDIENLTTVPPNPDAALNLWQALSAPAASKAAVLSWTATGPHLVAQEKFCPVANRQESLLQFDW